MNFKEKIGSSGFCLLQRYFKMPDDDDDDMFLFDVNPVRPENEMSEELRRRAQENKEKSEGTFVNAV